MPDQCMFCWHPAEGWPGVIQYKPRYLPEIDAVLSVSDSVRDIPLCKYHLSSCLSRSAVFDVPECIQEADGAYYEIQKITEDIYCDENAPPEMVGMLPRYYRIHELLEDIVCCVDADISARVSIKKFNEFIKWKLTDLAKRAESGKAHRCANPECHHFASLGGYCGTCENRNSVEKTERNLTDRVDRLLEIWRETE